jgi:hypothetical protein
MKKTLSIFMTFCFLVPGTIFALMPPDDMEKRNLEAKLILVGEVKGTGKVLLPEKGREGTATKGVFILDVLSIVKGYGMVDPGDELHILFQLPEEPKDGLIAHKTGSLQVKVDEGDLVVVYIDNSRHHGFYRPLAEGSSVVVIRPSVKDQDQAEKTTEKP